MQTIEYLEYLQTDYSFITYEIYCEALDLVMSNQLTEGFFDNIRQMRLSRELMRVFYDLKTNLAKVASDFKLNLPDVAMAFKQREMFNLLKAFKFNMFLIFKAVGAFTIAVRSGLLEVFREIYRTKTFQKVRSGAMKIDELLNKYPKLKMVGGVVIAGILIYMWLNMTFIGDLDYDFNFSDVVAALGGTYSITALFASPEGLMLMTLFASGSALGLSVPWLGKSAYNLTLALVYTAYYKYKGDDRKYKAMIDKFKKKMKKEKLR